MRRGRRRFAPVPSSRCLHRSRSDSSIELRVNSIRSPPSPRRSTRCTQRPPTSGIASIAASRNSIVRGLAIPAISSIDSASRRFAFAVGQPRCASAASSSRSASTSAAPPSSPGIVASEARTHSRSRSTSPRRGSTSARASSRSSRRSASDGARRGRRVAIAGASARRRMRSAAAAGLAGYSGRLRRIDGTFAGSTSGASGESPASVRRTTASASASCEWRSSARFASVSGSTPISARRGRSHARRASVLSGRRRSVARSARSARSRTRRSTRLVAERSIEPAADDGSPRGAADAGRFVRRAAASAIARSGVRHHRSRPWSGRRVGSSRADGLLMPDEVPRRRARSRELGGNAERSACS